MSHLATEAAPPPPENRKKVTIDLAHFSMQYSDPTPAQIADANKIFGQGYDGITGTEAGKEDLRAALRVAAHRNGYNLAIGKSNWCAVRKDLVKPRTYRKGVRIFVDTSKVVGHGLDLHVTWIQWDQKDVGTIALMASHYATKGVPGGHGIYDRNTEDNRELAKGIGGLADKLGRGRSIVFYGGDQNIIDQEHDTFFGEDLTSVWDELNHYEKTKPYGTIDVIASYDRDGRVEAKYARAVGDDVINLHTDHFGVEAGFTVLELNR